MEISPLEDFVKREVIIQFANSCYEGKINKPNYQLGYVDLNPSIVFSADNKNAHLEDTAPTRLSLQLFALGSAYSITPVKEGYLEQRITIINKKKEKEALGFQV